MATPLRAFWSVGWFAASGVMAAAWAAPSATTPTGGDVSATLDRDAAIAVALDGLEGSIEEDATTARNLERVLGSGRGNLSRDASMSRYLDAVYQSMLGRHEQAAEAFLILATQRLMEPMGLQGDVEWYLAEELFLSGNFGLSETRYLAILKTKNHPFRTDAVRRLLEIYAKDADLRRFEELYDREIVRGSVQPNDLTRYTIGKALWLRGDATRAAGYFDQIPAESPFSLRARYFRAALRVASGTAAELDEALASFRDIAAAANPPAADVEVVEAARLAVARILYERGRYDEAVAAYESLDENGPSAAVRLYELTHAQLRRGRNDLALMTSKAFLDRFPDDPDAASLSLLRADMLFRADDMGAALKAYEDVGRAFVPVRDRFSALAASSQDGESYVHAVMDIERDARRDADAEGALPPFAMALLRDDPELDRAIGLFREIEEQDSALDISESLIQQIGAAIGSGADAAVAAQGLRVDAAEGLVASLRDRSKLLHLELEWLGTSSVVPEGLPRARGRLDEVDRTLDGLSRRVRELSYALADLRADRRVQDDRVRELTGRMTALKVNLAEERDSATPDELADMELQIAEIQAQIDDVRRRGSGPKNVDEVCADVVAEAEKVAPLLESVAIDAGSWRSVRVADGDGMDPIVARLSRLHETLQRSVTRYGWVNKILAGGAEAELYRIREAWMTEKTEVAKQRRELAARYGDADVVASTVVRSNFARIATAFADDVMKADFGVVQVYWSDLTALDGEIKTVKTTRIDAERELLRQYAYLEATLDKKTRRSEKK
jgi:tetratricopeptide (TPR) repeat protein